MGLPSRPGKDPRPGPREPWTEHYNDPDVICILPPRWRLGRCGLSFSLRYGSEGWLEDPLRTGGADGDWHRGWQAASGPSGTVTASL